MRSRANGRRRADGARRVAATSGARVRLSLTEVVLGPIWVWFGVGEVPNLATVLGGAVLLGAIVGHALSGLRRWRPSIGVA